jgi:hypothetical protein
MLHGRQSRAAGTGTWGEGLDSLWRIASRDERFAPIETRVRERALCVAGMLLERQVSVDEGRAFPDPVEAAGAWYRDGVTRMDDQQHALSALLDVIPLIEAEGAE